MASLNGFERARRRPGERGDDGDEVVEEDRPKAVGRGFVASCRCFHARVSWRESFSLNARGQDDQERRSANLRGDRVPNRIRFAPVVWSHEFPYLEGITTCG